MESKSSSSQPPVTLSKEVRDKLFLADFFDLEPPCDWNVIHYLNKLVQKNPAISARPGNKALYDDADLMLKHVVPGTVAETMLRQMTRSQMTATSKQVVGKFWKTKPTIASNKIEYDAQKKRMQSQMAEEVVDEMRNQRRKRTHVNDTDEEDNQEENSGIEEGAEEIEDIWIGWKRLLKGLQETATLSFLSPERHDIIWCGKELRRRPLFPADMYERLINKNISIDLKVVDRLFQPAISQATDAIDLEKFKCGIENLRSIVTTTSAAEKALINRSLEQILEVIAGAGKTLSSSEGCLRFYVVDPLLRNCNDFLLQHGRSVLFFPGEIELDAMTMQLQSQGITDGRLKYNADGKILVEDLSTEILLSEVSSSYGENSKGKTCFDHHKAMFGLLAMLRTIASLYKYGSFETFSRLKLHFVHTHDRAIRHWTMSTPVPGVYVMNKEQRVGVIDEFRKQKNNTVHFVTFSLTLASALEETMGMLDVLKDEHDKKESDRRFEKNVPCSSLLELVCPQIVRLNENKHMVQIADDGPKSPVYIPNA